MYRLIVENIEYREAQRKGNRNHVWSPHQRQFVLSIWLFGRNRNPLEVARVKGLCGEDTRAMTGNPMELLEQKAVSEPGFHAAESGVALDSEDVWEPRCTSSKAPLWRLLVRVTQLPPLVCFCLSCLHFLNIFPPFPGHFSNVLV